MAVDEQEARARRRHESILNPRSQDGIGYAAISPLSRVAAVLSGQRDRLDFGGFEVPGFPASELFCAPLPAQKNPAWFTPDSRATRLLAGDWLRHTGDLPFPRLRLGPRDGRLLRRIGRAAGQGRHDRGEKQKQEILRKRSHGGRKIEQWER